LPPINGELPEGSKALPAGTKEGLNDWKRIGYGRTLPAHRPTSHCRMTVFAGMNNLSRRTLMRRVWSVMCLAVAILPGVSIAADLRLTSPSLKDQGTIGNAHVFNGFGCSGDNLSPELRWEGAPKDTKSFAVTVYDPDAPTGSGWWHWIIFNIPSTTTVLPAGAGKPDGDGAPQASIQSMTDFGQPGYGGPCPPPGDKPHRYIFTVYALKVDQLPLKKEASGAMVGFYLNQNVLAKGSFTAKYGR
jgi:Raf kinase inhibitor-like YbhB/YbcL family protein